MILWSLFNILSMYVRVSPYKLFALSFAFRVLQVWTKELEPSNSLFRQGKNDTELNSFGIHLHKRKFTTWKSSFMLTINRF